MNHYTVQETNLTIIKSEALLGNNKTDSESNDILKSHFLRVLFNIIKPVFNWHELKKTKTASDICQILLSTTRVQVKRRLAPTATEECYFCLVCFDLLTNKGQGKKKRVRHSSIKYTLFKSMLSHNITRLLK